MIRLRIELAAVQAACLAAALCIAIIIVPLLMPDWIMEAAIRALERAQRGYQALWRFDERKIPPISWCIDGLESLRRRRARLRLRLRGRL